MIQTPSIAGVTVCQRGCLAGMRGIQQPAYRFNHRLSAIPVTSSTAAVDRDH
jgi:hypothetical protein